MLVVVERVVVVVGVVELGVVMVVVEVVVVYIYIYFSVCSGCGGDWGDWGASGEIFIVVVCGGGTVASIFKMVYKLTRRIIPLMSSSYTLTQSPSLP